MHIYIHLQEKRVNLPQDQHIITPIYSYSKANIGPLTRRQPQSPNVYHSTINSSSKRFPGAL